MFKKIINDLSNCSTLIQLFDNYYVIIKPLIIQTYPNNFKNIETIIKKCPEQLLKIRTIENQ